MPCHPPRTNADKSWPYTEYYLGERDQENRKNGIGRHHWSGAESLEWYIGRMVRDTMHGYGDYRWRYVGPNHTDVTYEGRFYNNEMHGYGVVSYPDGRVFTGLFHNNIRWGPGVVYHACLREDVGLWYGYQLIRLAWRPPAPTVAIDFTSNPIGSSVVAPLRVLLTTHSKVIGAVNSAIELLKQYGSEPLAAADKWTKLYPKTCTDTQSQLCHVEIFDRAYYKNKIKTLTKVSAVPEKKDSEGSLDSITDNTYYAWNNNEYIIHMMSHCYTHEDQRKRTGLNLKEIMCGPRSSFKSAGKHELDCRTVLMASYLGHITHVAQLINENDVNSDIADIQGNSALMYAACGDQPEIIHFLVSAGAEVDAYNDACCTPLGTTLLRYALEKWDIPYNGIFQALLPAQPPSGPAPPDEQVLEWKISRDLTPNNGLQKSPSKLSYKPKKMTSLKDLPVNNNKKKPDSLPKPELSSKNMNADQPVSEELRLYTNITNEYLIKVVDSFSLPTGNTRIPYIFDVHDMNKDVEMCEEEQKKVSDKNPKRNASKVLKDTTKPSRDLMWQDKEDKVLDAKEQIKQEKLSRIMSTILQLLSEGADPRNIRCPQPPLFIASVSGSADLIRHLMKHGADINEVYDQAFGYTILDVAVSAPFTFDNLDVIRSLLENGANADHRLPTPDNLVAAVDTAASSVFEDEGPTLLHAILARKVDFEHEEEIRRQILELLLKYGCNPITRWKGRSAVDMAMSKNMEIFDIFIKSPATDLNAIINDSNQYILVKMFYLPYCRTIPLTERLQTLTNLLLYGADPLIKCQNGNEEYSNLFVYVRKVLADLQTARKPPSPAGNARKSKSEAKPKKPDKIKKDETTSLGPVRSVGQSLKSGDDGDYKQALDLVVECARLLYIRWLQAKLMKELIDIVNKYKHRSWNMILKEHKNKKAAGLWLTAVRCLEIWQALQTTKKAKYNDEKVLKYVLCIIHFYYKRTRKILRSPAMTFQEKTLIEFEVDNFIHEHKMATAPTPDIVPALRPYVTPELTVKQVEKFNVCFECAMPLEDAKIPCSSCKLIAFCSFECMKTNIDRINCHPCSSFLRDKYFPSPEETEPEADKV